MVELAGGRACRDPGKPHACGGSPSFRHSIAAGTLRAEDCQREVVIYTHARPDQSMVEVENTRTVVTPEEGAVAELSARRAVEPR